MVDLDLASSEMARLAKVGTGPQCRRSAPRTHDHAQGRGLGRPTLEKRLYGPVCGRNRGRSSSRVTSRHFDHGNGTLAFTSKLFRFG